jgi:hypothetical protein
MKELQDSIRKQIAAQRKIQKQNQRMAKRLAESYEQETDYSPLAALVDTWTGSNFARNMPDPESAEDRMRLVNYYNQQGAQAGQSALKNELGLLRQLDKANNKSTKRASGDQYKAAGFGMRAMQSSADLDNALKDYDPTAFLNESMRPERYKSEGKKLYDQAQRNFINAVLRRESGAAIAPSEFESAEAQYFPLPGDSEKVLEQKKRNRELVITNLKNEAGTAWDDTAVQSNKAETGAPSKGSVVDGYEFLGGDPSDKNNWRKK